MNYLISAYSINPYHGSEDGVGWNWVLQYEKHYRPGDRIIVLTKNFNKKATERGLSQFGIQHVELQTVDVPRCLNWFREKHSMFHHMYYILWQHWAWRWVKKSGIQFDVIHHVTMGDYRIPGEMYQAKSAKTIFGPVGGAQTTPQSLKQYEKNSLSALFRTMVNISCSFNPVYIHKIRKYSCVVASNAETYQQLSRIRGKRPVKRIVEIGIAEEYRGRENKKEEQDRFRILFAGRLIEKKGVLFLMETAKLLQNRIPFTLEICGNGHLRSQIQNYIKQEHLEDSVILRGGLSHREMLEKYSASDLFVLPSLRETGGTVLIEAMAFGLPIVAFNKSFCRELCENKCGIFVDTDAPLEKVRQDFCDAIVELAQNREKAKQLGQNGYRYANEELTWDKKFELVYEGL